MCHHVKVGGPRQPAQTCRTLSPLRAIERSGDPGGRLQVAPDSARPSRGPGLPSPQADLKRGPVEQDAAADVPVRYLAVGVVADGIPAEAQVRGGFGDAEDLGLRLDVASHATPRSRTVGFFMRLTLLGPSRDLSVHG
jgi:hypothetical protein